MDELGNPVSHARYLFGPWETRDSISGMTGGHQGAIVDLSNGDWYGFVMVEESYPVRIGTLMQAGC